MPVLPLVKPGFLLLSASLSFVLSHPSFICADGIALFGWLTPLLLLLLVRDRPYKRLFLFGLAYGALAYGLYAFWLFCYSPFALAAVVAAYGLFCGLLFVSLGFASTAFSRGGWLFQALVLLSFDYLRTLGPLGFHYGVIGYSQWRVPLFIHTARLAGVWGISACMYFFASLLAGCLAGRSFLRRLPGLLCYLVAAGGFLLWGNASSGRQQAGEEKLLSVALIQPCSDPKKNGVDAYRQEVQDLMALTDRALEEQPDTELVVWPENAVVPDILQHYYRSDEPYRHALVRWLLSYIDGKTCAFVLGNNHAGSDGRNGNAVLYFQPGKNVDPPRPPVYTKMRLVPFSEGKLSPGSRPVLFSVAGFPFVTPVCFEDTFPLQVRRLVAKEAALIVNLSNDSWSYSRACQKQHLAMAAFRSAENDLPSIRSTASGETCVIDRRGKVVSLLPAFEQGFLTAKVPLSPRRTVTLYQMTGDGPVQAALFLTVFLFLAAFFCHWNKKQK